MTHGFVALADPERSGISDVLRRQFPGFIDIVALPNLLVLADPAAEIAIIGDHAGALIGTAFDPSGQPLSHLPANAAHASAIGPLVENLWGGFVAIVAEDDGILVQREPSGTMPCYHAQIGSAHLFASDVTFLTSLLPVSINWRSVAYHLLWPERRAAETSLDQIDEVMPGERWRIAGAGCHQDLFWSPWAFAGRSAQIEAPETMVDTVRRATQNSVSAWGRRYPRPLVSLSGGLDSSILTACLPATAAAAVTFLTDEALGDERRYAGAVASRYKLKLLERRLELAAIDPRRTNAASLPRPVSRLFAQSLDHIWRTTAIEAEADAMFHGGGGDNVFCFLESATPYLDSLLVRGPGPKTHRTLLDLSRMTNVSTWHLRYAAARKMIRDRGHYRWFRDLSFLTRDAIGLCKGAPQHPWFAAEPASMLPGKRAHVASLVRVQNYLDAVEPSRVVPVVAPLVARPVMEACLSVPTWAWCEGGLNRAVARRAFASILPSMITERRGKGSPDAFDAQVITVHRAAIREMLLDGMLVQHRLVEPGAIDAALAKPGPMRGTAYLRISTLVDVEAWLQSWSGRRCGGESLHA